jgi:type VI secretion system protein ImpF
MAKHVSADQELHPSVFDRLFSQDAERAGRGRVFTLADLREAISRDLEDLLNTRQSHGDIGPEYEETRQSILTYGLPDLSNAEAANYQQREDIGRRIEEIIARFEPRLKEVHASIRESADDEARGAVRFAISAKMVVDPCPDVVYDTTLDMISGRYSVAANEQPT